MLPYSRNTFIVLYLVKNISELLPLRYFFDISVCSRIYRKRLILKKLQHCSPSQRVMSTTVQWLLANVHYTRVANGYCTLLACVQNCTWGIRSPKLGLAYVTLPHLSLVSTVFQYSTGNPICSSLIEYCRSIQMLGDTMALSKIV